MTTADPGVVDRRICCHGYNAEATGVSGRKEDGAMTTEQECTRLIITGLSLHQREVVMSATGMLDRFIKLIPPGMVENNGSGYPQK